MVSDARDLTFVECVRTCGGRAGKEEVRRDETRALSLGIIHLDIAIIKYQGRQAGEVMRRKRTQAKSLLHVALVPWAATVEARSTAIARSERGREGMTVGD